MFHTDAKGFTEFLGRIIHQSGEHDDEPTTATEDQAESRVALADKSLRLRSGPGLDRSAIKPVLQEEGAELGSGSHEISIV